MGWTSFRVSPSQKTVDLVISQINSVTTTRSWEVVDHSMRGNVFYGLVKRTKFDTNEVEYFAVVYLTSRRNGEFGYKDMDESMGPYYYDCPNRILNKLEVLSPNPSECAKKWRDTCRQKQSTKSVKIENGQTITFKNELNFRVFKENTFKVVKVGAKVRFIAMNGTRCQITKWKEREFTVSA
jgi:hypothetical protein